MQPGKLGRLCVFSSCTSTYICKWKLLLYSNDAHSNIVYCLEIWEHDRELDMVVGKLPSPSCLLGLIAVVILKNDSVMLLWECRTVSIHSGTFWRIKAFPSGFFFFNFTWISSWFSAAHSEFQNEVQNYNGVGRPNRIRLSSAQHTCFTIGMSRVRIWTRTLTIITGEFHPRTGHYGSKGE